MPRKPTIKEYLNAIDGSMGFINTIANRTGVSWHTAKNKIEGNKKLKEAYNEELEKKLDLEFKNKDLIKHLQKMKKKKGANFVQLHAPLFNFLEDEEADEDEEDLEAFEDSNMNAAASVEESYSSIKIDVKWNV